MDLNNDVAWENFYMKNDSNKKILRPLQGFYEVTF